MPTVTGTTLCKSALVIVGAYAPSQTLGPQDGAMALEYLNDLLSEWSQGPSFIPVIARERFTMTADKGGPTNPYTIGVGGNFNTTRPATQNAITAANLVLTNSDPEVRVPLSIYTDDIDAANQVPGMSSGQPTGLYYNPTYASGLGSIFLWPVPDTADNDLELFIQKPLSQFASLATSVSMPEGVLRMLKFNLADALQVPFGRVLPPAAQKIATSSLARFKRANLHLTDLANDAAFTTRPWLYNINSGQ